MVTLGELAARAGKGSRAPVAEGGPSPGPTRFGGAKPPAEGKPPAPAAGAAGRRAERGGGGGGQRWGLGRGGRWGEPASRADPPRPAGGGRTWSKVLRRRQGTQARRLRPNSSGREAGGTSAEPPSRGPPLAFPRAPPPSAIFFSWPWRLAPPPASVCRSAAFHPAGRRPEGDSVQCGGPGRKRGPGCGAGAPPPPKKTPTPPAIAPERPIRQTMGPLSRLGFPRFGCVR